MLRAFSWGLLLLVVACGRAQTSEEKIEFTPYLKKFAAYSREAGRSVSADIAVTYGNLQGKHLGSCSEGWLQANRVEINRTAWKAASESLREVMIFHELGHCVLERNHLDTEILMGRNYVPSSIMATHGVPGALYAKYQDHYLKELFSTVQ